jgi:hypothetical protein
MPTHALMRPPATPEANAVPYAFSSRHFLKLIEAFHEPMTIMGDAAARPDRRRRGGDRAL